MNFLSMFTSHSIIWGIDVNLDGAELSPNSFWSIKSDLTSDKTPQLGVLKPEADIDKLLNLIANQLSMWLESRNIRVGNIGSTQVGNISGVSKIIDTMDTTEDRKETVAVFTEAEEKLWELVIENMHPVWRLDPEFQDGLPRMSFSPTAEVEVYFPTPEVRLSQVEVVDTQIKLLSQGLTDKAHALMEIHGLTLEEAEEFAAKIDVSNTVEVEAPEQETPVKPAEDETEVEDETKEE
jgi:hypothetical protein